MKPSQASDHRAAPVVDVDRIEHTYAELKKMEIRLDPNPIDYGPKRFNNRIAKVRSMLTRLEQIFLQTSEDLHYFKRQISKRQALYDLEKRDLMVNDPRCRVGRSQGEREALADVQLRKEIESIQELQLAASDLESLMVVIKSKRTDLKDIQGRMREQMKLIEHDIGMGARWGRNSPPTDTGSSSNLSDIDGVLADVDASFGIIEGDDYGDNDSDDDEGSANDSDLEEDVEDSEDGSEEEDLIEAEDPKHDPAPHPEPEVLIFGEDEEGCESPSQPDGGDDLAGLIPEEDAEGSLPEDHTAQEEADDFLDSLAELGDDEDSQTAQEDVEAGINDLIASLTDD